jgi:Ca2+-binding EF-hand superfamily protein
MQKLVLTAIAGTACLLAAAGVLADDDTQRKIASADSFAALDRNGDHRISRSEAGFDRRLSETFAELDTDGDGFVSIAEFTAAADRTRITVGKLTQQ